MGSGMRFRVWSNETTAAQRPEMTGKKQQGVNSMKSRRHGRHRNRLPYAPRQQTDKQASQRRHVIAQAQNLQSARKSSTEQNGEHNRIGQHRVGEERGVL